MMRPLLSATFVALGIACVTRDPGPVKTEVRSFPDGAVIEYNGKSVGRAPAAVMMPQDKDGRLTNRAVIRALPNSSQTNLYAQSRIFEPTDRYERVPDQIMIDLTIRDLNAPVVQEIAEPTPVETAKSTATRTNRYPKTDRSKPTQPVGIDRWNPGIY